MQAPLLSWALALGALATLISVQRVAEPPPLARPGAAIQGSRLDASVRTRAEDPAPRAPGEVLFEPDGSLALERLAFDDYDPPELRGEPVVALGPADFPPELAALDGTELVLRGYPLVTQLAGERTDRLLLTRFPPGCCFGSVPVIDEWVAVELAEGTPPTAGYEPVALRGRFQVGEVLDEQGFVESLYRLQAARLEDD